MSTIIFSHSLGYEAVTRSVQNKESAKNSKTSLSLSNISFDLLSSVFKGLNGRDIAVLSSCNKYFNSEVEAQQKKSSSWGKQIIKIECPFDKFTQTLYALSGHAPTFYIHPPTKIVMEYLGLLDRIKVCQLHSFGNFSPISISDLQPMILYKEPTAFYRERVKEIVAPGGIDFSTLNLNWQVDREIVLVAVESDYRVFALVANQFKSDPDVLAGALKEYVVFKQNTIWGLTIDNTTNPIIHATPVLKQNREAILRLAKIDASILEHLPEFRNDFEIGLAVVISNGMALQYLHPTLQSNEAIVSAAVKQDCRAIFHGNLEQQGNPAIFLLVVQQEPLLLEGAPDSIRDNKEIILLAVQKNAKAFKYASFRLQADPDVLSLLTPSEIFLYSDSNGANDLFNYFREE